MYNPQRASPPPNQSSSILAFNLDDDSFEPLWASASQPSQHTEGPLQPVEDDSPVKKVAAVKPKRKYTKRQPVKKSDKKFVEPWTIEEEVALCKVWVLASENSIEGNGKRAPGFWTEVTEHQSGACDTTVYQEAEIEYRADSEDVEVQEVAPMGRDKAKKKASSSSGARSETSGDPSLVDALLSKFTMAATPFFRRGRNPPLKTTSQGNSDSAHIGLNLNDEAADSKDVEVQEVAPMGRDMAKKKASSSGARSELQLQRKESSSECLRIKKRELKLKDQKRREHGELSRLKIAQRDKEIELQQKMNALCNARMNASVDVNDLFVFDDVSIRKSHVSKMPFRKMPSASLNVPSRSKLNKSLPRIVRKWFPKLQPLAEPIAKWIPKSVQNYLWIIDSGCSKHMTGNRALLTNFVEKFLGTVLFGNNDFAVIAGYGDVVIGSICYLLNDYDDVGKPKAKGDIGVFVGYSKDSASFRVYNKRARKIHESVKVSFDEISKMASKRFSLEPDLEDLFQKFYDEYFDSSKIMKSSTTNVETSNVEIPSNEEEVFQDSSESFQEESSSSSLNDDVHQSLEEITVPSSNTQSVSNNMVSNVNEAGTSHNVLNERLEDAYFDASTSFHDPSNVHTFYQPYPHEKKWTKDHPLHKRIEITVPSSNTQSVSNNMVSNVNEAGTSHNVLNERLEDAYFDAKVN
nr:integrase, catalytic region, zinc finger, CCHC-type, peptidase aspartic, catalytic [Tanacetum cinerariifolium]